MESPFFPKVPQEGDGVKIVSLREDFHALFARILSACPDGRERDQAIARLEESAMWAVKAITHSPRGS